MRCTVTAAALAALVSSVLAQTADFDAITKPLKNENVPAGEDYTIVWEKNTKYTGGVTLSLLGGADPGTLIPLGDIGTADNADSSFVWAVSELLGDDPTYGIQITLDSDTSIFQFSNPFHITGGKPGGSDNSSSSATGTATYTISSYTSTGSTTYPTYTPPAGNYSTTAGPPKTTLTTTQGSGPTGTGTGSQSTPTSGAAAYKAGPLALVGGLVVAALAL